MALDASSHVNWGTTYIPTWRERLVAYLTAERVLLYLTLAGFVVTICLLVYAIRQTNVMVLTVQYQSAVSIIDQSTQVTEDLLKQPNLQAVLKSTSSDRGAIESVNKSLESYQSLIFKASLLRDKDLLPAEFWNSFVADFCGMYIKYPFVSSWWGEQRTQKPYADLSPRYRDLSYNCQPNR
jgi:hypothetical protein